MNDSEKIIKGLESQLDDLSQYADSDEVLTLTQDQAKDILSMLKEQEAVEPVLMREGRNKYYNYYVCPRCDEEVVFDQNYCSECGAKFMWEGR